MRRVQAPHAPSPDEIPFKSLYRKEIYDARTRDGWVLQITRYRPVPQEWEQPILGEPLLLVPGWSQNRHAFTCASFVKRLLLFGADCHIVELRGHGRSSRELQIELCDKEKRPLPRDLDWDWDLDSYLLEDIPAAVHAVKQRTRRDRVVYLGNSMGGMLGYGYAGSHRDLSGLITIGAPSDIGRGFLLMRAAALFGPAMLGPLIDALCVAATGLDSARHGAAHALRRFGAGFLHRVADVLAPAGGRPPGVRFSHVPVDAILRQLARVSTPGNLRRYELVARHFGSLLNPARVTAEEFRWLLSQGGEKEPRRVVEQFARWIRRDEMKCYRTGYDYKAHFKEIDCPMAVLFGDLDKIASAKSTSSIYRKARSDYFLWRPVKDNSHLELTVGYDLRQICEDVKNVIEHAARRERARRDAGQVSG
ncbi:MAG TPA: alpha/beta fold hydrolase [Myxococcales bacterium]|nr:alpha/beta fold hydrolase [Myxococcales bacterium]